MSETYSPEGKRKPGRPSNAERAVREEQQPTKRAEATKRERRRRSDTSATAGLKLHVPAEYLDENYEYRWINDDAGFGDEGERVGQRMHAKTVLDDWDIVTTATGVEGQGEGTPVKRLVGKGEAGKPINAYLCRKPKDWYREDKAKEQQRLKEREDEMRRGAAQGSDALKGPTSYIPEGGIRIGDR